VRGLVNLKRFSRVSIPYEKRTRVASTNVPDSFHYSTDPSPDEKMKITDDAEINTHLRRIDDKQIIWLRRQEDDKNV